jgi:hypothetical protein
VLPFPKRTATDDAIELDEDDIVLVDEAGSDPSAIACAWDEPEEDLAATVQRRRTLPPPGTRRILDEVLEEDIAGQCLAQLAAVMPRPAAGSPASYVAARSALAGASAFGGSLPNAWPGARSSSSSEALHTESLVRTPPSLFVRRSSASIPVFTTTPADVPRPAQVSPSRFPAAGSMAPVSFASSPAPRMADPTVIVVRGRPRAAWIVAAAAAGALLALGAMRLAMPSGSDRAAAQAQAPLAAMPLPGPTTAPAPAVVVAAPRLAVTPPPAASASAAIVSFGEDEGVAIHATLRKPAAAPAAPASTATTSPASHTTAPRPPSVGPALPDGSYGLAGLDTSTASTSPAPAPLVPFASTAPATTNSPPRKRALSPEQQLAEAQLKASMK